MIDQLYKPSLSLLTDLYQITMAYGYWKSGNAHKEAVFNLFYRQNPFNGGFAIACGLDYAIEYLQAIHFDESDTDFLRGLTGNDGLPLFEEGFLSFLREMKFECDIEAVPEGTVVFPHEPLLKVRGPLWQCQLIETPLLNMLNFQTLIATKAARMKLAAGEEPVLEFGLRRAQGIDGALAASRAAYIGGVDATSNVLAGKLFGIPVKGTHAHSWVMSFENETEAFGIYADAMPNNCVFLVDTYDTLEGVRTAVEAGKKLREKGHEMVGIRLDSGDLAYLSIEARKILDAAGFEKASIVASNDLDEYIVASLKQQNAKVNVWGIGTKLVTAYDQPALGGVYKIAAIKNDEGKWEYKVKLSEQFIKISNPGVQQVKRFYKDGLMIADMIYNEEDEDRGGGHVIVDPLDTTRRKTVDKEAESVDLLVPIFHKGKLVYEKPCIEKIKTNAGESLGQLHNSIKRFSNPHAYPVGLSLQLYELKQALVMKLRGIK